MAVKFGHDAGLGDGIVWVKSRQRAEMTFSRIDAVGRNEDEPMLRPALAVAPIGEPSHSSGEPFWRTGDAEDWCQELVLDGALTWHFSGWRSGKSQWAAVAEGSNHSFGTDGAFPRACNQGLSASAAGNPLVELLWWRPGCDRAGRARGRFAAQTPKRPLEPALEGAFRDTSAKTIR
jgi:hypothetical protein